MQYDSFVIRLWQRDNQSKPRGVSLHGQIEHIQSGKVCKVENLRDINKFILTFISSLQPDAMDDIK